MFSTKGRLNRLKFLIYSVGLGIFTTFMYELILIVTSSNPTAGSPVNIIFYAVGAIVMYNLSVRRFHDLDKAGHYAWLIAIPCISWFLFMYLIFKKGTDGANKYGKPQ